MMQRSDARKLQEEKLHRPKEATSLTNESVQADYMARHIVELKRAVETWRTRALDAESKLEAAVGPRTAV